MRIGWVGGVERNERELERLAYAAGHDFDAHGGHTGGRGTAALESLVRGADLVVILTGVNSHSAVLMAKRYCRRYGKPSLIVQSLGRAKFESLLEALSARDARSTTGVHTTLEGYGVVESCSA